MIARFRDTAAQRGGKPAHGVLRKARLGMWKGVTRSKEAPVLEKRRLSNDIQAHVCVCHQSRLSTAHRGAAAADQYGVSGRLMHQARAKTWGCAGATWAHMHML